MNKNRLTAEIWETQAWLILIFSFLVFRFGEGVPSLVLAWVLAGWGAFTFVGVAARLAKARLEEALHQSQ